MTQRKIKFKKGVVFRLLPDSNSKSKEGTIISKAFFMFLFFQESRVATHMSPHRKYADIVVFDLTSLQYSTLVSLKDKDRFEWSEFFTHL